VSQGNSCKVVHAAILLLLGTIFFVWLSSYRRTTAPTQARERGTIVVATNAEYQPFTFINEQDEIVGFDIDVAREVVRRLDKNIEIKDRPFDALLAELQFGHAHLAAAGISPSPERAGQVLFTTTYFGGDPLVMVTRTDGPSPVTVNDLKEMPVVVNEGFTADYYLSAYPGIDDLTRLPTVSEAFLALKSGRADVFVSARSAVRPFFALHGAGVYKTAPLEDAQEQYALAISKRHPDLLKPVQDALDEMERDGTLEQLRNKWNLGND